MVSDSSNPKIIGILGPSYCGSTLVNFILGALPGVVSLGETHWLAKIEPGANPDSKRPPRECQEHGPGCSVFTPTVLERFETVTPAWYRDLAEVTGAQRALVTADKKPRLYERFGQPDVGLVPFRDPRGQVWSILDHDVARSYSGERQSLSADQPSPLVEHVIARLGVIYDGIGAFLKTLPAVVVFPLESLVPETETAIRGLASALDLPYSENALRFWETDQHSFIGNFSLRQSRGQRGLPTRIPKDETWFQRYERRFTVDDRWKDKLAPVDAEHIVNHPTVKRYLAEIDRWRTKGTT